jgi:hypothetical protein
MTENLTNQPTSEYFESARGNIVLSHDKDNLSYLYK